MDYRDIEIWLIQEWVQHHPLNILPLLQDLERAVLLDPHSSFDTELENVRFAVLEWQDRLWNLLYNKLEYRAKPTLPYSIRKLGRDVRAIGKGIEEIDEELEELQKRVEARNS